MMKSDVIKNKNKKPLTLSTAKNTINTYITLSDRLKQAGIKESKPKYEGKASKKKKTKSKRNGFKMSYSEDYMNNQNPGDRIKKLQKPLKNYAIPYIKESFPNQDSCGENVSKNPKDFSQDLSESVRDRATIFVSLDFIEDCQKYKRKIRKGNWQLKGQRSIKNLFSNRNKFVDNKGGSKKFPEGNSSIDNQLSNYGDMQINLLEEKKEEDKKFYSVTENSLENPNTELVINDPIEGKGRKGFADKCSNGQAFFNKRSSDDIAKIDKKYLLSLLSCIRNNEEKLPAYESKQSEEKLTQGLSEKKKKITGKDYFERILKTKELLDECFSNADDSGKRLGEKQNECNGAKEYQQSDIISTRVVRDLTKSEEQIKLKKAKNFYTHNNSNVKNKNVTYSKPDIKDGRKQRKPRNKFMKNNVKEFIETSFPSEVSKVADVKELWRRETQKKSENSLTSYSSCTVPESDDFSGSKNLESYRVLKKLVGEEINNIANKSENKVKTKEMKTKENPNLENQEQEKNICRKFISPISGNANDLRAHEKPVVKRRLMAAECGEYNMAYEDQMQKSQKMGIHVEDITKEGNPKMKRLQEKTKQAGKLPGQVIENWSILNRLEQAFLGLGAPTLQKNLKGSSAQKGKRHSGDEKSNVGGQKSNADYLKESKKAQNDKDVFAKQQDTEFDNAVLTSLKKKEETPSKIPKTIETEHKLSTLKEKYRANKSKKDSKQETLQTNIIKMSTCDENGVMQMKKKHQIRPDTSSSEKIHLKSVSRNTKTEKNEGQLKHETTSRTQIKSKIQKMSKSPTSEMQLLNLNLAISGDNLERKKTFDVISVMDASVIQPRKSRSCDINDGNMEKLSHANDQNSKSDDVFSERLKNVPKLRSIANDTRSKLPAIPTRLAKNLVTDKPQQTRQDLKYVGEKKCLKASKLPKSRVNQENKNEEPITMEQAPQCAPLRTGINTTITNNKDDNIKRINKNRLGNNSKTKINNSNTNINKKDNTVNVMCKDTNTNSNTNEKAPLANDDILRERAVKKRSILSVHLNQTPRKLVKIKEKDNSDCTLENTQNYLHSSQKGFKTSYSNTSVKSMGAYDMVSDQNLRNHVTNKSSEFSNTKTQGKFDILPRLTSSSVNSTLCYEKQGQDIEQGRGESKTSKTQPLWEQDISHYHTIVREIMSQYKRIDGFLKQTEHLNHLNSCSNDSVNIATLNDDDSNKLYNSFNNSQELNKEEYKKISEYTELPIFEYKSKLRRSKNGNFGAVGTRKNLSLVKDSKTDADMDVKDYHAKIQKVLDSQLYVDTERLTEQNEPKIKFKEKNSSLQEILTCGNREMLSSEDWKRSFSAPKTLFSQNSPLTLFCAPPLSSADKSLGSITSISKTGYSQETENESFREIKGK